MKYDKHIVLLTPGFPANEADDSCIPALQVYVKTFHELFPQHKLSVITFHYPFTSKIYEWNHVAIFPCDGRNKRGLKRLKTLRNAKSFFESIHKENPVDLIHSFWLGECALTGKELSEKFKIPHVNTLMGQDVLASNRFLRKTELNNVPEIALCERHAAAFEKNAGRKAYTIIPWGIEENMHAQVAVRNIDIFAAGSLIELKQYDLLIKTTAALKDKFPDLKIALAGDGPLMKDLKILANDLGVTKHIQFAGQLSRKNVLELMARSKVFFHPSSFESYGFVFAEARKFGLPVVSSSVGIAKAGEDWKLADSLEEMTEALSRFLLRNNHSKSEIIYSAEKTANDYETLYLEMIANFQK